MRRSMCALLFFASCLLLPRSGLADGKMFSPAAAKVDIPEQSAVIGFDGKSERLIISTAFAGPEGEYAWVMPLPAMPKVERVSNGILPTLRSMCRPRIVTRTRSAYVFIAIGVFLWLAVMVRRSRWLVILLLLCMTAEPWVREAVTRKTERAVPETTDAAGGVSVHQRVRVGEYDVATVTARSARALLDWLAENGFQVSQGVEPVLADYIRDGWCFTTYRFNPQSGSSRSHPLSFTFPTNKAVYPMRLTAVDNDGMSLELFVLGEQEATVPGMERRRCGHLRLGTDAEFVHHVGLGYRYDLAKYDHETYVLHPGVQEVAKPYKVVTALYGELSPQQMSSDFYLDWKRTEPYRAVLYSPQAAATHSRWYGAITFCGLTLLGVLWIVWRTYSHRVIRRVSVAWIVWAVGALVVAGCLFKLPEILRSNLSDVILSGCVLLFLGIMLAAAFIPWRVRLFAATPMYLVGVGALVLFVLWVHGDFREHMAACIVGYACITAFAFLGSLAWKSGPPERKDKTTRRAVILMLSCGLIGSLVWFIADHALKTRVAREVVHSHALMKYYGELSKPLWARDRKDAELPTEAEAREMVSARAASLSDSGARNPFTDEPYREEDSPGNYQLVLEEDRLILYVYDANGAPTHAGSAQVRDESSLVR